MISVVELIEGRGSSAGATPSEQASTQPVRSSRYASQQQSMPVPTGSDQPMVEQEQMQALISIMERQLQQAQAMQTRSAQAATQQPYSAPQHAPSSSSIPSHDASRSAAMSPLSALLGSSTAAAPVETPAQTIAPDNQPPQQPSMLLQLGPALSRSVKQTQVFRLLAAMFLAYAALSGWQTGVPSVVLLVVADIAVVLAGAAVLPAGKAADLDNASSKMPWRLRSLDVVALVPGLRELFDSLAGYNALATAISQDYAAFVVVAGLLLSTDIVPATASWGWRL